MKIILSACICLLLFLMMGRYPPPMTASAAADPEAYDCSAQTYISTTECEALVALYNSTDGPNWTNAAKWQDPILNNNPCSWEGVGCKNSHVFGLTLDDKSLNGTLPPELDDLTEITYLVLNNNNQLSGSIPIELSSLSKLTKLELANNPQLSGSLPAALGNLGSLLTLIIGPSQISGSLPHELSNLSNLTTLTLVDSNFSGSIPTDFGSLTKLGKLDLSGNQFSGGIPVELTNLTALTQLDLSGNMLSGRVPPEIGSLAKLDTLALNDNPLSGPLPTTLTSLNLSVFYFAQTRLCEPTAPVFQDWLLTIITNDSTGAICPLVFLPLVFH